MLGIDIELEFITKDNIDSIWKYIKSINVDVAQIFYMYYVLDMTLNQISKELNINESTVKSNLYRMIKRVKEVFLGGDLIEK